MMPENTVLSDNHRLYPAPNKHFLAIHAAIGNILHATARGAQIEKTLDQLGGGSSYGLATDGSTKITELLSVTRLSLLSSNPNPISPSHRDKHPQYARARSHGTENEPPSGATE
jgi:hypothetical protein